VPDVAEQASRTCGRDADDEAENGPREDVDRVVDAHVDARKSDQRGERVQRHGQPRYRQRERGRTREGDGGVARRQGPRHRQRDERLRLGVREGRPVTADPELEQPRAQLGSEDRHRDAREQPRAPQREAGESEREREPDEPERTDVAERLEDRIEHPHPVLDDPPLDARVDG